MVAKGNMGAAIEYAYATSASPPDADQVDAFRKQVAKGLANVGPYAFHELILEEKVGSRYAKLTYIIGYEKSPVEVTLLLYRPKDKWSVLTLLTKDYQSGAFASLFRK